MADLFDWLKNAPLIVQVLALAVPGTVLVVAIVFAALETSFQQFIVNTINAIKGQK